ncbi:MAG: low specificity L-threonine aldolase [Verrucomicrobium sp.]|nr:low specificity L-threonine aldolase [Verrucomicrobium sp.]
MRYEFTSDNTAGVCPEAWEALREANAGFVPSYGTDPVTQRAADLFREFFETDCDVFFVFNGTAANSLALASLCQPFHSVICHEAAHIETDECGAPEFFSNGTKLLLAKGEHGRLAPAEVEALVTKRTDIHYPRPRVLSLSLPTELGTVYTPERIGVLCQTAARHGLKVHVDGARFFNAVAALGAAPKALTWQAGVDVLCCGGTKQGIGFGEAVVFFNKDLAQEFGYRCKQAGQLASKMRYLAAPWVRMLEGDAWRKGAEQANRCARLLESLVRGVPGVEVLYPVEANAVFLKLPPEAHQRLAAKGWSYYTFMGDGARFMCSWATREEAVRELAADLAG